jgi:hypothetical protein
MLSFHHVHEIKAQGANHVFLYSWFNSRILDGIWQVWYGLHAITGYPKLIIFNFLQVVISTWRINKCVWWDRHLCQLIQDRTLKHGNGPSRSTQPCCSSCVFNVKEHGGCTKSTETDSIQWFDAIITCAGVQHTATEASRAVTLSLIYIT